MPGYLDNPKANQSAFTDGWFRTGDEGWIDADGYLFLTGRLKELINRGGEKISLREIDEVLLDHPDVKQALAFAIPHAQLGEEVGAVVVLLQSITRMRLSSAFKNGRSILPDFVSAASLPMKSHSNWHNATPMFSL